MPQGLKPRLLSGLMSWLKPGPISRARTNAKTETKYGGPSAAQRTMVLSAASVGMTGFFDKRDVGRLHEIYCAIPVAVAESGLREVHQASMRRAVGPTRKRA